MDRLTDYADDTFDELMEQVIDVEVISTLDKTLLGVRVTLETS